MENYHGTDDDAPDAYEHWLGNLDTAEIIEFGEQYGNKINNL